MTHSNPFPPDNSPDPTYAVAPDPAYREETPAQGYSTPPYTEPAAYSQQPSSGAADESTADTAKQQAGEVAGGAADAGKHVAGVAQEQAQHVAGEVKNQAKDLLHQTKGELTEQASAQQKRVASGLRSVGEELGTMAQSSENPGLASDLIRQAADRSGSIASWLEQREPGHVLDEVTRFARRRPGAFLALAAGAGLLAGRLGRGLLADGPETSTTGSSAPRTQPSPTPQPTPSQARRIVPAYEETFGQYSDDVDGGNITPPADRPVQDRGYTVQPGNAASTTGFQP